MLLAGDIGATKTLIGLFAPAAVRPAPVDVRAVTTLDYDSLEAIVQEFLADHPRAGSIAAASFGVAGPIVEQVARLTNVPWEVDAAAVRELFGFPYLTLLNDLQAMAYSVPVLLPDELEVLQRGFAAPTGNAALIAAGTGLGEALLHHVNGRFIPSPTEGGHADYAPRTPREIGLLRALVRTFGRGEYEQVLSGRGLVNIHQYVHDGSVCRGGATGLDPVGDPALISQAALENRCARCVESLDLFVTAYGAEAGNLALHTMASAGVFVGGGIAPKILPALRGGAFMQAFRDKPPMDAFLSQVPVAVILNDRAGLLGSAVHANATAQGLR
ncbi:MAG TPA: glucokinase [Vicinamibacterales bacterium]|nr:glucokinase [Vicinamibacterales bacterium]